MQPARHSKFEGAIADLGRPAVELRGSDANLRSDAGASLRKPARASNSSALIAVIIAVTAVGALLMAMAGLVLASRESDSASIERQSLSVRHAIDISIDELALEQETVAIWDDAASKLTATNRDWSWIHDNLGSWLYRIFNHDETFILDGSDRPIYAAAKGRRMPPGRYRELEPSLHYLVDSVRGRVEGPNGRHDRNSGRKLAAGSTVRTTARATHDSHLMLVGGRPAAASAMLVQPSTANYVTASKWPVLVSVRYLDGAFLSEIAERQLIASPRFTSQPTKARNEAATPIETEWGERIGYLVWKPDLPGSGIVSKLLPLDMIVFATVLSLILILGLKLRKAVDEAREAEREAKHLALHDPLTGLPNRSLLQSKLEELVESSADNPARFALLLLDLDDFKITNDTLGHDAGDALLVVFGRRLRVFTRANDVVARLGGDEFAIVLAGTGDIDSVNAFADDLFRLLREPVTHDGKVMECRASIGAALFEPGLVAREMLKRADLALYASKASGRGKLRLYEPAMSSRMAVRSKMLSRARHAVDADLVRPFYQPKIDLRSGEVIGFEALLRCCPPDGEPFGPTRIAAAFDDAGLAAELGSQLVSRVFADLTRWAAEGLPFGHVAVNAAASELQQPTYAERLLGQLETAKVNPGKVQIEVTESVLLGKHGGCAEQQLKRLAEAGVKVALDDFGTGYASLSHLRHYPVNALKIDRRFIRDLHESREDQAIVQTVLSLADALDLDVVAEGVETEEQRSLLQVLGCKTAQGYLFGRPVRASEIETMLRGIARAAAA